MLVLERRIGERIMIGKDIWIMVVSVKGDKVKLGIEAPRDVVIVRERLIDKAGLDQHGQEWM